MAAISKKHHQFFEGACEEKGQGAIQIDHEWGETGNHPMLAHTQGHGSAMKRVAGTRIKAYTNLMEATACAHTVCV